MKSILSSNEKAVFEVVFNKHDPDIKLLSQGLTGKLIDKEGNIVKDEPDMRFVSKLKSTGLKKISDSLTSTARSLRLDIQNPPKKYSEKIKACLKGLNFMLNVKIYVIYLLNEGPIAWYDHESKTCKECTAGGICVKTLNHIMDERNLPLPNELQTKSVEEKAEWVFEQILG